MLEFAGDFAAARHRATARRGTGSSSLKSQYFALTNSTIVRARITNGRPVRAALRGLGNETTLRSGQPNISSNRRRIR